jgi:hypothetical protein
VLDPNRGVNDAGLAPSESRTFRLVLYDALASEAMGTLTTGVFLTAGRLSRRRAIARRTSDRLPRHREGA